MSVATRELQARDGSTLRLTVHNSISGRSFASVDRIVDGKLVWGQCGTSEWAADTMTKMVLHPERFGFILGDDTKEIDIPLPIDDGWGFED